MWRRIPLNAKLIISLLFVHILAYSIAAEWLIQWNRSTRMGELTTRLDIQADFVEDVLEVRDGRLTLNPNSEIRRELDLEKDVYFLVVGAAQETLDESKGPPLTKREQLRSRMRESPKPLDEVYQLTIDQEQWFAQREKIVRSEQGRDYAAISFVAIRGQAVLDEIEKFQQMVVTSSVLLSLLASLATGIVVSHSTRNLRRFAHTLRTNNPLNAQRRFDFKPLSYEESLLHESYQDMIDTVGKSAESQRLFIAHASHELKTPLATALVVTELALSRDRSLPEYRQAHQEVLDELRVLTRLSTTLLDFASLEETGFNYQQTGSCDLNEVLGLVVQRWLAAAEGKGISIRIDHSQAAVVWGRGELWETVLSNLVDNAIKYGKTGGEVHLRLQTDSQHRVSVLVEDNGVGLSASDLARMGQAFFKVDTARAQVGSFGLGFAHARRIVERLGGRLEVESEPEKGTRVHVRVLLADQVL